MSLFSSSACGFQLAFWLYIYTLILVFVCFHWLCGLALFLFKRVGRQGEQHGAGTEPSERSGVDRRGARGDLRRGLTSGIVHLSHNQNLGR